MAEFPRPSGTHQPLSGEPGPSNSQILNSNEGKPESPTSVTQTPSPTPSRRISHPVLKTLPTSVPREAVPVVPGQVGPIQRLKPGLVLKTPEQRGFDIKTFEKSYVNRLHPVIASALAKNANKLLFRPPTKDKKVAEKTPRNTRLIDDISVKAALDLLISQANLSDARKKEIVKLYSKDYGYKIGQIFSLLKLDPKKPLPKLKDTLIDSEAPISFNFLPANPVALVQQQAKDIIGKPELLAFMRLPYNKARTMELTKALNTHRINSDSDDGLDDVQSIVSQTQHPLLPFVRLELFLTRQGVGADLILEIVSRLTRDPKVQFELAGINPIIGEGREKQRKRDVLLDYLGKASWVIFGIVAAHTVSGVALDSGYGFAVKQQSVAASGQTNNQQISITGERTVQTFFVSDKFYESEYISAFIKEANLGFEVVFENRNTGGSKSGEGSNKLQINIDKLKPAEIDQLITAYQKFLNDHKEKFPPLDVTNAGQLRISTTTQPITANLNDTTTFVKEGYQDRKDGFRAPWQDGAAVLGGLAGAGLAGGFETLNRLRKKPRRQ